MKCVICKFASLHDGNTTVTLQRGESTIIIKIVPAQICDICGEYYHSHDITRQVMAIVEGAPELHNEVEVLQFAA